MSTARCLLAAAALSLSLSHAALASSDEAWKAMEADMHAKCRQAASEHLKPARVVTDPVGADKFGLAITFGRLKNTETRAAFICLYDKTTKTATLGSELTDDVVRVRLPAKKDGAQDADASTKQDATAE
ncbi:hypothetical protein MRS76_05100 [Rhizobiaceae bacterium n13]|uniref:Uncharacterized protein n=1 Tax=Ferirhizobium litorale TaxID=2927786 RepID=A0AAE3QCR8_9HYPH|nr:hypothetical protein [Fererhizobium litorale]MDI7861326.1 hypothetical protein [Fererhizobium litorale]MDI7921473.1 hypothetical protein [Fererhizobium litorale]